MGVCECRDCEVGMNSGVGSVVEVGVVGEVCVKNRGVLGRVRWCCGGTWSVRRINKCCGGQVNGGRSGVSRE